MALVVRFARPWRWADSLSANAYGIYLMHYAFVIWIQYVALRWTLPAFVKGIAVSLATVGISWMTVALLRQSKLIARVV
jgi:surface polysaccharide O-acyltransferase-like enzyme